MKITPNGFSTLVDSIYNLPLEDKVELKTLLQHNIDEARREEIAENGKAAFKEYQSGKLKFASSINTLKKML